MRLKLNRSRIIRYQNRIAGTRKVNKPFPFFTGTKYDRKNYVQFNVGYVSKIFTHVFCIAYTEPLKKWPFSNLLEANNATIQHKPLKTKSIYFAFGPSKYSFKSVLHHNTSIEGSPRVTLAVRNNYERIYRFYFVHNWCSTLNTVVVSVPVTYI